MKYVIGAIVGLLWGALVAWLNSRINKIAIGKNDTKAMMEAMMEASLGRTVIDVAALGAVFLLRNVLPFNFEATIAGTAASLGLLTVFFAFQLSKPEPEKKPDESVQPEKTESRGEETK